MSMIDDTRSGRPVVLVMGATGGIGAEVARQLLRGPHGDGLKGWEVRVLTRRASLVRPSDDGLLPQSGIDWRLGDAMNASDVLQSAQGARFIVHAVNPPRYHRWRDTALPMLAHTIAAAREVGARVVLPGNVYNFGPDAGTHVAEGAPQRPLTRKGMVRVEMEAMLRDAASDPVRPVRSLIVRAGDFFGAQAPASWFQTLMVRPGRALRKVVYPGAPEVGHAWAYLPDLAATMCRLMALDQREPGRLASHEVLHFGGHWLPRGIEMAEAVRRVSGRMDLPISGFPWRWLMLLAPFVEVLREMQEMRYLWRVPLQLDNRKLLGLLGEEPHTPLDEAVRASLVGLGVISSGDDSAGTPLKPSRA